MAVLCFGLIPLMSTIHTGGHTAFGAERIVAQAVPERPQLLFLCQWQQPPIGGYYLML
jgi:hypothetical protein